jgi:hypothetical protein
VSKGKRRVETLEEFRLRIAAIIRALKRNLEAQGGVNLSLDLGFHRGQIGKLAAKGINPQVRVICSVW